MTHLDWATISTVINIILVLLLAFQWIWDRAREHAVKNNILAARRIISRITHDVQAASALDILDAALATIGARKPFREWSRDMMTFIRQRLKIEEGQMLTPLPSSSQPVHSPSETSVLSA